MKTKEASNIKIKSNKKLDQFFLKNEQVLEEEVNLADLDEEDIVLEIGAGTGNLTKKLAAKCKVVAIEKDKRYSVFLDKIGAGIIYTDALKVLKENRGKKGFNFTKIVSNIPYSISQKLILEIMKHKWKAAVIIVQKEFAQKMIGKSRLSILLEDCAEVEIERIVPKEDFYPVAVDSAIVKLKQKKIMDENFWKFLEKIYKNRNKNVKNAVENCPENIARKKIHQLSLKEIKDLYINYNKGNNFLDK